MSCLFNSLSHFINESSSKIREKICDYLEFNLPIIENISTNTILEMEEKNYVKNMRKSSTWGGGIEIQCACNIYNSTIIVINIRNNPHTSIEFIPLHKKIEKIIKISWNGGHYEPIK